MGGGSRQEFRHALNARQISKLLTISATEIQLRDSATSGLLEIQYLRINSESHEEKICRYVCGLRNTTPTAVVKVSLRANLRCVEI